jgi:Domain of unknown function (DUF5979)
MLFLPGTAQVARADSTDPAATAQASTGTETPTATPSPDPSVTPSATKSPATAPVTAPRSHVATPAAAVTSAPEPAAAAASAPTQTTASATTESLPVATGPPATVTSAPEPAAAAVSAPTQTTASATTESLPVATGPPANPQVQPLTQAAAPAPESVTAASTAGVCGTNPNTGHVDTFMQRSSVTLFANGALTQGLYEGGYVYQRVEMSKLSAGVNVLLFTYQVRYKNLWAYDYIDQYSTSGATLSSEVVSAGPLDSSGYQTNTVTVTFDMATDGSAVLYFAAHIASEFVHGYGTGASSISGAPYHVSLVSLNCASTGSKDNQIMASAIQGASVTIIKVATPADGTNFPFHIALANSAVLNISGTFTLAAGSSTVPDRVTYGKVAPGSVTISEDSPLPSGWHLSGIVCTGATPTVTGQSVSFGVIDKDSVTCTFTNSSAGSLQISKVFDPLTSGFAGTFSINYACTDGTHSGTVSLAAGASTTIVGIPAGTQCSVTEPSLPTPTVGWAFGTPSISPAQPVTISGGGTATVTVTNSISRDMGSFKVSKSTTNPDGATLPAAFTGSYNCGTGYTGTWSVANGGSQTFSGIPTGSVCSVIEDTLAPISGYTWGTPSYSPATITISTKAGTFEIAVTNSISRDRGSFSFTKVLLNLEGAAVQATFPLSWDCGVDTTGAALTGKVDLAAGDTQTVSGIPTGNSCSVTEGMLGSVPLWTWQTPVITAAVIVGSDPETTGLVTVTNSISKDRGSFSFTKVLLNPEGAAVQPRSRCRGTVVWIPPGLR